MRLDDLCRIIRRSARSPAALGRRWRFSVMNGPLNEFSLVVTRRPPPPSPFGPLGRSSGIDLRVENDLRVEADAALFLRPFRFKSIVTVLPLGKARS